MSLGALRYGTNLEELSLRLVFALPKASNTAFDLISIFFTRSTSTCCEALVTAAIYLGVPT